MIAVEAEAGAAMTVGILVRRALRDIHIHELVAGSLITQHLVGVPVATLIAMIRGQNLSEIQLGSLFRLNEFKGAAAEQNVGIVAAGQGTDCAAGNFNPTSGLGELRHLAAGHGHSAGTGSYLGDNASCHPEGTVCCDASPGAAFQDDGAARFAVNAALSGSGAALGAVLQGEGHGGLCAEGHAIGTGEVLAVQVQGYTLAEGRGVIQIAVGQQLEGETFIRAAIDEPDCTFQGLEAVNALVIGGHLGGHLQLAFRALAIFIQGKVLAHVLAVAASIG